MGLLNKVAAHAAEKIKTEVVPTLKATARQGAAEMGQALKALPDSIGPQETTGTIGSPTQAQISQEFGVHGKSQTKEVEPEQPDLEP